jgi:enediyne biosynthesis protein E7
MAADSPVHRCIHNRNFHMPASTDDLVSPSIVHRHPAFRSRPDEFDPDRFLPSIEPGRRHDHVAFGLGPRACIGEHLAMIELPASVATLACGFDPGLVASLVVEFEPQVSQRTRHPVHAHVRERAC